MQQFVQLPEETKLAIVGIVLAVVNLAVQYVSLYVPWIGQFLDKYKAEWAVAISVALLGWLENALPDAYPDVSVIFVQLVVAVILTVLGKITLAKTGVRRFQ